MNRINKIKKEITEERLRNGWNYGLNNSKRFAKGESVLEKHMIIRFSNKNKKFILDYSEEKDGVKATVGFITSDFNNFENILENAIHEEKDLEFHNYIINLNH